MCGWKTLFVLKFLPFSPFPLSFFYYSNRFISTLTPQSAFQFQYTLSLSLDRSVSIIHKKWLECFCCLLYVCYQPSQGLLAQGETHLWFKEASTVTLALLVLKLPKPLTLQVIITTVSLLMFRSDVSMASDFYILLNVLDFI